MNRIEQAKERVIEAARKWAACDLRWTSELSAAMEALRAAERPKPEKDPTPEERAARTVAEVRTKREAEEWVAKEIREAERMAYEKAAAAVERAANLSWTAEAQTATRIHAAAIRAFRDAT